MNHDDFLEQLRGPSDQETCDAATALTNMREATEPRPQFAELAEYVLEKQAGAFTAAMKAQAINAGRSIAPAAPLMIAGALLGGTAGYFGSRRREDSGESKNEELTKGVSERLDRTPRERKGFSRKITADLARHNSNVARTFADHPVKASLISAALGSLAGLGTAKLLGYGGKVR
jgi:hypothetical protein